MPSPFATSFKFSRYGETKAPPRNVTALTGRKFEFAPDASSSRRREARVTSSVPSSWEAVAEVKDVAVNLNLRPVSAATLRGGASVKP